MLKIEKTYRDLMNWMVRHPQETLQLRQEMQTRLLKRRFIYDGKPMPTALLPLFLKRESLALIKDTSERVDALVEKVIRLYFQDPYVRSFFPLHGELPTSWLHQDPGFSRATVISRHDILFDGKNLKYIEFNADNPGGKGWTDLLEELFREHPFYKELIDQSETGDRQVLKGLKDAVLRSNQEAGGVEKPRVALISFHDVGSRGDEEIVRDYFVEHGLEADLIDPRNLEYRHGGMYSNRVRFDVLLRTLKARYFLYHPREMGDFHRGVAERAACMVNPWRALLGSEKSVLSFLTNPLHQHYFTADELQLIRQHIPWTRMFDETVSLSPAGEEVSLKGFMLSNREDLVVKPSAGAGGEGVLVGRTTDPEKWRETIEEYFGSPGWVVQEYVEIPKGKLPVIEKGKVVIQERYFNLSPYVFGGKYAGILGRISSEGVINVSAGGGQIPVFPLREEAAAVSTELVGLEAHASADEGP